MSFKQFYNGYLNEMAYPSNTVKNTVYYHGTGVEHIESILKDGYIKASDIQSNEGLTPKIGMSYITPSIEYACIYAGVHNHIGYKTGEGYVVVIDNNTLKDVYPDEDVLGDYVRKGVEGDTKYKWLVSLLYDLGGDDVYIESSEPPLNTDDEYYDQDMEHWEEYSNTTLYDAINSQQFGWDMETHAQVGKFMMDRMDSSDVLKFIEMSNSHIAHKGKLGISKIYHITGLLDTFTVDELEKYKRVF